MSKTNTAAKAAPNTAAVTNAALANGLAPTVEGVKAAEPKAVVSIVATKPATKPATQASVAPKAVAPKAPAAKAAASKAVTKAVSKPAAKAAPKAAVKAAPKAAPKAAAPKAAAPKAASKVAPKADAKAAVKAAPKAAAKPAPKAAKAADATPAKDKARKDKLVRDSFTMPEAEYAVLGQVKKAALKAGFEIKKSELLRVGVALISKTSMATLKGVLASLPQLKTGRPKKS